MEAEQNITIFETSWEVCNKVGGIYTVLSTKAATLQKLYKDCVVFIGPDIWTAEHPSPWFKEGNVPAWLTKMLKATRLPHGIEVRAGRWLIPGRPIALLVKFDGMYEVENQYYGKMWEWYGVDSLHAYGDYDEACAFSLAAAIVIYSLALQCDHPIGQFHEWTTGMALLLLKYTLPTLRTIFTTHATSIGRSICGNGKPLYSQLENYDGDQMSRELNMESKHSLEKAAAREADVFTTVSEVTAREAKQLLDREPDFITVNGISSVTPSLKTKRETARARLLSLATTMKGRQFDDGTFIVMTAGRNEYRNKGLDIFLDVVDRQVKNKDLSNSLFFIMVPAWSGKPIDNRVLTHQLMKPEDDVIYNRIRQLGIEGRVIYVPCYLNGDDGVFNLPYLDLLPGADATVFPSYYEPWGYTPLESVAAGVPTITTSLSGFGQWILSTTDNTFIHCGVKVIERDDNNYQTVVNEISQALDHLQAMTKQEKRTIERAAIHTARQASWENFINFYLEAYGLYPKL